MVLVIGCTKNRSHLSVVWCNQNEDGIAGFELIWNFRAHKDAYAARSCLSTCSDSLIFPGRTISPSTIPAIKPNTISQAHDKPPGSDEGTVPCWANTGTEMSVMIIKTLRTYPFMVPPKS